ncbi:MAG TPA: hypothetical protein VKY53_06525 [Marinobacter sp.]|nr:hypothetical protein [Marinobacter sp.]
MKHTGAGFRRVSGPIVAGMVCVSMPALGQSLSDTVESISGSASAYGEAVYTQTETLTGSRDNTKPGAGLTGQLGGALRSGASHLALNYGGTLSTSRSLPTGDQTDSSSINGAARYSWAAPANPLDFNLGHSVQSVRNNTGFALNAGDYDTRNTLTGGAGLTFYPGALSSLRLAGQVGKSFGSGDLDDSESQTVSAEFMRQLSERSRGGLVARRSWADEDAVESTIDTAQFTYERELEAGFFSMAAGQSWSESDYPGQTTRDSDAFTGYLTRVWIWPESQSSIEYHRELSDSTTDLSLNLPPILQLFFPETIELRELVISDELILSHSTRGLCTACNLSVLLRGERLESELSGLETYNYGAAANLGVELTNLHRLYVAYSWQGDSDVETRAIRQQRHQLILGVSRQLAEDIRTGVEFRQAWVLRKAEDSDEQQYAVRLYVAKDFSLTSVR